MSNENTSHTPLFTKKSVPHFPLLIPDKEKRKRSPVSLISFPHHLLQCGPLQVSRSSPLLSGTPQIPRSPFSPMGQSCTFSSCGGLSPPSYAAKPPTTPPASSAAASIVFFHIRTPSFKTGEAYLYIYIYLL